MPVGAGTLLGVGTATAVAVGVLLQPGLTAATVCVLILLITGFHDRRRLERVFLRALVFLLAGYAVLGRGFAYLGVPPVFVGEIVLGIGLLAVLVNGRVVRVIRSPVTVLILMFAAWSALRTVPYLAVYGVDALRDAATWGYAAFAIIVAGFLSNGVSWDRLTRLYGRFLPWLILWLPIGFLVSELSTRYIPRVPGAANVFIPHLKPGDVAVHLAGAAAFMIVGLFSSTRPWRWALEWPLWIVWGAGFLLVSTQNRGGMLAVIGALGIVFVLRPMGRWSRIALIAVVIGSGTLLMNLELDLGRNREVSTRQLVENAVSIVQTGRGDTDLSGTTTWRMLWWAEIRDYTIHGKYFWTGKGYGINLATDDGFQIHENEALRSPHNGHLTVLARSGVPGLVLWILLHTVFAGLLLRAFVRARLAGDVAWARINIWILAYWAAFMINAVFDVFLEGPQGGIWFWSLIGVGIAAIEAQRGRPAIQPAADRIPA